jgi:hypothetical protein
MKQDGHDDTSWFDRLRTRARRWDRSRLVALACVVALVVVAAAIKYALSWERPDGAQQTARQFVGAVKAGDCERIQSMMSADGVTTRLRPASEVLQCEGDLVGNDQIDLVGVSGSVGGDDAERPGALASVTLDGAFLAWHFEFQRTTNGLRIRSLMIDDD